MGMIRWIVDNQRYNADYLAIPRRTNAAGQRAKLDTPRTVHCG